MERYVDFMYGQHAAYLCPRSVQHSECPIIFLTFFVFVGCQDEDGPRGRLGRV